MADITGTIGDDTLNGTDMDDVIDGLGGDDIIKGGLGNDTLNGGAGRDALNGGVGDDVLNGGDDDDWLDDMGELNAAGGSDTLNGGRGNDTLRIYRAYSEAGTSLALNGGDGNDTIHFDVGSTSYNAAITQAAIDGGTGDDRVEIAGSGFNADIRLGSGRDTIWLGNLQSFLNWRGYDQATTMVVRDFAAGDAGDVVDWTAVLPINLIDWDQNGNPFGSGHARLIQSGSDTLLQIDIDGGADGYRTLFRFENTITANFTAANFSGYAPNGSVPLGQTLTGTGASDVLTGTIGGDEIRGEAGNDEIDGRAGADRIFGGDGNDSIEGGMGDDVVEGGAGRDYIYGGKGADVLRGGADDDIIGDGESGGNYLYGDGGNDHINMFHGIYGETGTSYIDGGEGDDLIGVSLYSESHVDVGAGPGADLVSLEVERGSVNVNLGAGTDTVRLTFYPSGFGFITGTIVLEDFVAGDGGEQLLFRDQLARVLDGWDPATNPFATGHLRLVQSGTSAVLEVDFFRDSKGFVPYVVFENTSAAALTPYNLDGFDSLMVYGTEDRDVIDGSAGDDTIKALGGLDSIFATRGHDVIDGGAGSDWLDVYAARIGMAAGPRHYTITADRLTDAAGALDTSFTGIEMVSLDDRTSNVTLDASAIGAIRVEAVVWAGTHDVKSGAGNDQISVRGGSGTFDGGAGDDWLWVRLDDSANANTLFVTEAAGVLTLTRAGSASLTARNFEQFDIVGSTGALRVDASAVSRAIDFSGTVWADTIIGSAGANQIGSKPDGLGAGDVFTGGGGRDWFTFWTFAGFAGATITDFASGEWVDLHLVIGARFIGTAAFSGTAGEIRYAVSNGDTLLIGDADGNGIGESVLTLRNWTNGLRETHTGSLTLEGAPNQVTGTEAGETLNGTIGDDAILALGGNDNIVASRGHDTVDGGAGLDRLRIWSSVGVPAGDHEYTITADRAFDASGTLDTSFSGIEYIEIDGANASTYDVTLHAGAVGAIDLSVRLGEGTHAVTTGAGNDHVEMLGGSGTFDGGAGSDTLTVQIKPWVDNHPLRVTQVGNVMTLPRAGAGDLTARNFESMSISSGGALNIDASGVSATFRFWTSSQADTIIGGAGENQFYGWGGGGAGDMLTGGNSTDLYIFTTYAAFAGATITNFSQGDNIDLHSIPNLRFIGTAGFSGVAGEIRYAASGGKTLLIGDADGDGIGESVLTLSNRAMTLQESYAGSNYLQTARSQITGTAAGETLSGTAGDDEIDALGGNDTIRATRGLDMVDGGSGTDTLELDASAHGLGGGAHSYIVTADRLTDGSGAIETHFTDIERVRVIDTTGSNVTLDASALTAGLVAIVQAGTHQLTGGSGADNFTVGGAGTVDGGGGYDALSFRATGGTVTISQSGGATILTQGTGQTLSVRNVENILIATNFGNGLHADASASAVGLTFALTTSGDSILGSTGSDVFLAAGVQTVVGDIFAGGGGADIFSFMSLKSVFEAVILDFDMDDVIKLTGLPANAAFVGSQAFSAAGQYGYRSGDGITELWGDSDGDGQVDSVVHIVSGAFVLAETAPGSGVLHIVGELPDDDDADNVMTGTDAADYLDGGAGNDRIEGRGGDDILNGGADDDLVMGGAGSDTIHGDGGNDALYGGADRDLLYGGAGNDTLSGEGGNDALDGGEGDDWLGGDEGDDVLRGGSGNDWLVSLSGIDMLYGGLGDDSFLVSDAATQAFEAIGGGNDILYTNVSYTLAAGAEIEQMLVYEALSTIAIALTGNGFDNNLVGNAGSNRLEGGDGNDSLSGRAGDDWLVGGRGEDTFDGGDGIDTADFAGETGAKLIDLSAGSARNADGGGYESLVTIENAVGSDFGDVLTGDGGANRLDGGGGSDWLSGGAGNDIVVGGDGHDSVWGGDGDDWLYGGEGDDTLWGGAGHDTASYANATGGVEIDLSFFENQQTRGAGIDTLVSIENLVGSAFDDVLAGDALANVLTGGGGNDRFVFGESACATRDTITDFSRGDRIDLSGIDANGAAAGDAAFAFLGSAAFGGLAGQLRVTGSGDSWLVEADLNGDRIADFSVAVTTLAPGLGLAASDFLL